MATPEARKRYYEVLSAHQLGDPDLVSCLCNIHVKWNLSHQLDALEDAGLIAPDLTNVVELYKHTYAIIQGRPVKIERTNDWSEVVQTLPGEVVGLTRSPEGEITIIVRENPHGDDDDD